MSHDILSSSSTSSSSSRSSGPPSAGVKAEKQEAETNVTQESQEAAAECEPAAPSSKMEQNWNQSMHIRVAKMANTHSWPLGPETVEELFGWPMYNAVTLLRQNHQRTNERKSNVTEILSKRIEVNEAFAGTGTGAVTLHQALVAFRRVRMRDLCAGNAGDGAAAVNDSLSGSIQTATSCDIEPVCQKVLASLPEDSGSNMKLKLPLPPSLNHPLTICEEVRPRCINGDIVNRLTDNARPGVAVRRGKVIFNSHEHNDGMIGMLKLSMS